MNDEFAAFKAGWKACCDHFGVEGHEGAFDYWDETLHNLYIRWMDQEWSEADRAADKPFDMNRYV